MLYRERQLLADGRMLDIRLRTESRGGSDVTRRYRLRYGRPGAWLVSYVDGRRTVNGRRQPYAFRSVEQLRYDFERDLAQAQVQIARAQRQA